MVMLTFDGQVGALDRCPAGGYRIQRVPDNERRGRVHTSTVTVAILDADAKRRTAAIPEDEIVVEWFSGSGAGGQHRNKHQNCCRVRHLPTGLVETRQGRERAANERDARAALARRLAEHADSTHRTETNRHRKTQVGSGMRGDKVVTIRFQDDTATNHVSGKAIRATDLMKGKMEAFW